MLLKVPGKSWDRCVSLGIGEVVLERPREIFESSKESRS